MSVLARDTNGRFKPVLRKIEPNGTLPLSLGWRGAFFSLTITGGPFDGFDRSDYDFGVAVRKEATSIEPDVRLPIRDFSVPEDPAQVVYALLRTMLAAVDGKKVYVGCMGGWGRTGLFLALLAKAAGIEDPIGYVRQNYTSRAVETAEQEGYVKGFDVAPVRKALTRYAWKKRVFFFVR
jgi:hypothetical protein